MYYVYNIHNIIYKYNFGKRSKKLEQQMIYVQDTQKNTLKKNATLNKVPKKIKTFMIF